MTTSTVQPETVHGHSEDPFACPVFRLLPDQLQEESRNRPFLWDYLHTLAVDEIGVPEYAETLENVHRDLARPNLVYPTGAGVYAHICPDMEDSRNFYVSIEPAQVPTLPELLHTVDLRLMDYVETLKAAEDPSMRAELLLKCIDDICTLVDQPGGPAADAPSIRSLFKRDNGLRFHTKEFSALMRRLTGGGDKIEVSALELMGLKYVVLRDKVGLGVLEPLIGDPYIEDVSCSGLGNLFLEHRIFGGLKASIGFASDRELDRFVIRLSEKIGRPVTYREPIVDAVLPDGSRVNIVFGGDVSKRGSNFTIRKFSATPMSLLDLISSGSLSHEMAAYMSFVLREEMNVFISGETASGKTTLLNALTTFINPNSKIVSIEDTPELQVPHMNWIREVSRGSTKEGTASSVSMMDLLKAALRQRPNEIIIGEIRGEEGAVAFQAMQTGHACMATFHAATVEKLIQRLTGSPINIPKVYIDNLNVVVITSAVRLPNGKTARRIVSINEIVGYDPSSDAFSYTEIFKWNPATDTHEFPGYRISYLLEEIIAPKRGMLPANKYNIYGELQQRAAVLKKIEEKNVGDFYDFHNVLSRAYREGLFR